ncbi:hypothetical protein HPDFL43_02929 [Hoeflea phototrophica DFL-43]|uniref:Uncharacterized protein n=1 Tax=Hoeflea phototrophica (strain DSM 17068 / NCIMB 14078 / DFL-43) TaxID=411684 RepID=A9DD88_HOEPD|nr:hypothetical protein [Hoeflea phototrophica]EDQ32029.1 hypothetical protein HPDFL43_02929 [Hoeflea phototrophica DFL-43]
MPLHRFDLAPVSFSLDTDVGHIAALHIADGDRQLSPLHRAPWADDSEAVFEATTPPNVKRLSGDFFCAPFGRNDVVEAPSHGWPANSDWEHVETTDAGDHLTAVFTLAHEVMGATLEKRITLRAGHPFIYQEHRFEGGQGAVSVAHHVIVHLREGGRLAVSPKAFAFTPPESLEPDPARGRSILAYPARSEDLGAFPLAGGGTADLTRYPPGESHEDFLTLVERQDGNRNGVALGWSVVSRIAEQDRILILKNSQTLPVTMLWMSNGGRDYAPWSSRHTGVLGIEDGRASGLGHADSIRPNAMNSNGIPTAFDLGSDQTVRIRQVIGACAIAPDEGEVADLSVKPGRVTLHFEGGSSRTLPFDSEFLESQEN